MLNQHLESCLYGRNAFRFATRDDRAALGERRWASSRESWIARTLGLLKKHLRWTYPIQLLSRKEFDFTV